MSILDYDLNDPDLEESSCEQCGHYGGVIAEIDTDAGTVVLDDDVSCSNWFKVWTTIEEFMSKHQDELAYLAASPEVDDFRESLRAVQAAFADPEAARAARQAAYAQGSKNAAMALSRGSDEVFYGPIHTYTTSDLDRLSLSAQLPDNAHRVVDIQQESFKQGELFEHAYLELVIAGVEDGEQGIWMDHLPYPEEPQRSLRATFPTLQAALNHVEAIARTYGVALGALLA